MIRFSDIGMRNLESLSSVSGYKEIKPEGKLSDEDADSFWDNIFSEKKLLDSPFFISITQSGVFEYPKDIDKKMLKGLLNVSAPAVLLSYIRGMISQVTAFSGYPALIIPLINFSE